MGMSRRNLLNRRTLQGICLYYIVGITATADALLKLKPIEFITAYHGVLTELTVELLVILSKLPRIASKSLRCLEDEDILEMSNRYLFATKL